MKQPKTSTLKGKVWWVLERYPESRDCDIRLTQILWWQFFRKYIRQERDKTPWVKLTDLHHLPREDNVKRIRAKLQNDLGLFPPTTLEVAKKRGMQEEKWKKLLGYA